MRARRRTAAGSGGGRFTLGLRFFVLAIGSLGLIVIDHRQDHLDQVRQGLALTMHPLLVAVDFPFSSWQWVRDSFADRKLLREENDRLRAERMSANVRLQRLAALEAENARLRAMLDSTARVADRMLIAEILAVDLNPYRQRFSLNRGSRDGVYVGQALLDAKGVVGQVVRVSALTAEAVLITDADHAVPVTINRNGLRTIVVGTGDAARLRLPYLTNSADVEVGDLLVSSGLGGVFPAGYPVGRVAEVRRRPGQSFAEVIAEPLAELDRDREVLLVWTSDDDDTEPAMSAAQLAGAD